MNVTKNKIKKCLDVGDVVFAICAGGVYKEAKVLSIEDDCVETDLDAFFMTKLGELGAYANQQPKTLHEKAIKM